VMTRGECGVLTLIPHSRPMKNTISGNPAKAMMKLLVAADSDKVVGVHMVGPECAEIMQARPPLAGGPLPLSASEPRGAPKQRGCAGA